MPVLIAAWALSETVLAAARIVELAQAGSAIHGDSRTPIDPEPDRAGVGAAGDPRRQHRELAVPTVYDSENCISCTRCDSPRPDFRVTGCCAPHRLQSAWRNHGRCACLAGTPGPDGTASSRTRIVSEGPVVAAAPLTVP